MKAFRLLLIEAWLKGGAAFLSCGLLSLPGWLIGAPAHADMLPRPGLPRVPRLQKELLDQRLKDAEAHPEDWALDRPGCVEDDRFRGSAAAQGRHPSF
jgi:hypothetical protein